MNREMEGAEQKNGSCLVTEWPLNYTMSSKHDGIMVRNFEFTKRRRWGWRSEVRV